MRTETRFLELRAVPDENSRELVGVALNYGEIAQLPFGRERIASGAFGNLERADVILNKQHDRRIPLARTGGGGLTLDDNAQRLEIRAELAEVRDADDTLALVRGRILRGLSVEFVPTKHRFIEDGRKMLMEIERAKLVAVAVVDRPAYTNSRLKARWAEYLKQHPDAVQEPTDDDRKAVAKVWL